MATVGPIHVGSRPPGRGGGAGPGHRVTCGPGSVRLAVDLVALFERRKWERVIYLVRHGKAGSRWEGPDDRLRPLSPKGRRQAEVLAGWLVPRDEAPVLSSPYTRCVETVKAVATRHGREVEATDVLAEGGPVEPLLELLAEVPDGAVLCTHGDMLELAVEQLVAGGTRVQGPASWEKGVVWALSRTGTEITQARAIPPARPRAASGDADPDDWDLLRASGR